MHLKLDRFISKSCNGIEIQILMIMIAYLILILMEIPKSYGHTLLDKLRSIQIEIQEAKNFVNWSEWRFFAL